MRHTSGPNKRQSLAPLVCCLLLVRSVRLLAVSFGAFRMFGKYFLTAYHLLQEPGRLRPL